MKNLKRTPLFLVFILLLSSCVKHIDFSQINNFSSKPVFKSGLVYFTLNQIDFFDVVNSVEIVTPIDDVTRFSVLQDSFVQNNLLKAELDFEIDNQFNRRFTVNIEFLDRNNAVTHSFNPFVVNANNPNFKQTEVVEIANNQSFLSSTKVRVSIELSPSNNGSVLDPNQEQVLIFKSAGTFFLSI